MFTIESHLRQRIALKGLFIKILFSEKEIEGEVYRIRERESGREGL